MRQSHRPSTPRVLARGLRKRCPHCGVGRLFDGWYGARESCNDCGLVYEPGDGDTWGFMYLSTGFITGLLILGMLFIRPQRVWLGQLVLLVAVVVLMLGTLPHRKGLAIALDYLATHQWAHPDDKPPTNDTTN